MVSFKQVSDEEKTMDFVNDVWSDVYELANGLIQKSGAKLYRIQQEAQRNLGVGENIAMRHVIRYVFEGIRGLYRLEELYQMPDWQRDSIIMGAFMSTRDINSGVLDDMRNVAKLSKKLTIS